ncbi:MAG: hypothetical protein MUP36_01415 [Demequinaceae bacterium]|nr:hypothetical protein [Demequinaceae bacterium]
MSANNRPIVYRNATERITTILWGTAVVAFGVGVIAWLMGYDFDLELAGIVVFAILGLWILGAAIVAMVTSNDD